MVELTLEWPIAYEGGLTTVLKVVQWPSIPAIGVCVVPERGHGPVPIEPVYIEISSCAGTVKLQAHEMVDTVEFDALIALLKEDGWY